VLQEGKEQFVFCGMMDRKISDELNLQEQRFKFHSNLQR